MLLLLKHTVLHSSTMTDVYGLCTTWHQIIALQFNIATCHKTEVTLHAGMKQEHSSSPLFSCIVSHLLPGSLQGNRLLSTHTRTHTNMTESLWVFKGAQNNMAPVLTLRYLKFHNREGSSKSFLPSVCQSLHPALLLRNWQSTPVPATPCPKC